MPENKILADKVALVIGGSRGIGAAIVRRMAADGAAVAFTFASSPLKAEQVVAEVERGQGRALAIRADSADPKAVQAAVTQTVEAHGRLDVLVCNSGILTRGTIDAYPLEDFDRMVAVNVRSVFAAAQAASHHMRQGARIIVIGSVVANRTAFPGASVYSMTKGAVASLVRGMAIDLAPRGITVNTIQPGPTATDMNPADGPHVETLKALLPVGRLGESGEVAGFVSYLAGPEAGFITGASLNIDGGYTL
ncbi:3-oxoacyl-ACP reductase family protein [Labrys okinawensis]|uniref:3-oxoacyl-ACP reductase family protein n=1 Tax=Labrys okinawensis TaxID=346911 RepID=UPI0039BD5A5E